MFFRFFLTALAIAGSPCVFAGAGDKATLPAFDKEPLSGPALTAEELKGKVIFFEFWGFDCPPCRASLVELQQYQKKYQDKGFIVIANLCGSPKPEVTEFLKKSNFSFSVYNGLSLPEAGFRGAIPLGVLIGADGRIVATDFPLNLYNRIERETQKAEGGFAILGLFPPKKYQTLGKSIVSDGKNIEAKMAPLREGAQNGDKLAVRMCQLYDAWLEQQKEIVRAQCEGDPLRAMKAVLRLKTAVPSVTEFDERLLAWQNDPAMHKLLDISKKIDTLQRNAEKGRRLSPSTIHSLNQAIEQARALETEGIAVACKDLTARLNSLATVPKSNERRSR